MTIPDRAPSDRQTSALLFLVSATFLGNALQLGNGTIYNSQDSIVFNSSIGWLTASFVACLLAVFLPGIKSLEDISGKLFAPIAFVAITWQFFAHITTSPGAYVEVNVFRALQTFILFMTIAFACAITVISRPPLGRYTVPVFLLSFICAGLWLLRVDANPRVDVHVFHHDSTIALLQGQNPYTLTFPDIYGSKFGGHQYGPGVAANGRTLVGFPYMPLTLILSSVAQGLFGDYRVTHLLAIPLAALFMILARRNQYSLVAAGVFLLTPRIFFVLEQGYSDVFVILFFAMFIFALCRLRAATWVYGLYLASKQYGFLCLPLAILIHRTSRERVRFVTIALLIAGAITAPFLLWNPAGFMRSVVQMQFRQPFREDSLSYLAWINHMWGKVLPSVTGFAVAGLVVICAMLRRPKTPAQIAGAIALEFFAFFAFNKQAFANYYLFVIGAMCCSIAATVVTESERAAMDMR